VEFGVEQTLMPTLERCGMMLPADSYKGAGYDPRQPILQMADFNSLIASSQEHQVPIFELTAEQLDQVGRVLATTQASQKDFKQLFEDAADRVLRIIDAKRT
jgi:hypothetical protein